MKLAIDGKDVKAVRREPADRSRSRSRKEPKLSFFEPEPLLIPGRSSAESNILDAARRGLLQFSSKVSMNDVARIAGVSRGTVYNYFADRDSLIDAVVAVGLELLLDDVERAMAGAESFETAVAAAAVIFHQWHKAERSVQLVALSDEARVLAVPSPRFITPAIELFRKHAALAQERGELRPDLDLDAAAEWVTRIIYSFLAFPAFTFNIDRADALHDFVQAHVVRGLR